MNEQEEEGEGGAKDLHRGWGGVEWGKEEWVGGCGGAGGGYGLSPLFMLSVGHIDSLEQSPAEHASGGGRDDGAERG